MHLPGGQALSFQNRRDWRVDDEMNWERERAGAHRHNSNHVTKLATDAHIGPRRMPSWCSRHAWSPLSKVRELNSHLSSDAWCLVARLEVNRVFV